MPEIEAKFLLQRPEQCEDVLRCLRELGHQVRRGPTLAISDRYIDTPDWRVLRAGWACRRRRQNDACELMLKSLSSGDGPVFTRDEISQSLKGKWKPGGDLPAGPVGERLEAALAGHAPGEIFRLQTDRRVYDVTTAGDPAATVELAVDRTTIRGTGKRSDPLKFTEIELELRDGEATVIDRLAYELSERLGLTFARLSKFERGLQAVGLEIPLTLTGEERAKLTRNSPMLDLACATLARGLLKLRVNEPRAWEGLDPEGVHQMRVAIRRLRAALRTFRSFLPSDRRKTLDRKLRWLSKALGAVRDADVYSGNFDIYRSALPDADAHALADYRAHLVKINRQARAHLLEVLSSRRYRRLLQGLEDMASQGQAKDRQRRFDGITIGDDANALVRKPIEKMLRQGAKISNDSPDQQLHDLRILGKRVRYQTEFFAEFYPKRLKQFLKACRHLQDVLGEHQDAVVAGERLRRYAEGVPSGDAVRQELLALGRLVQIQARHGADERARFAKYWRRFESAAKDARLSGAN